MKAMENRVSWMWEKKHGMMNWLIINNTKKRSPILVRKNQGEQDASIQNSKSYKSSTWSATS